MKQQLSPEYAGFFFGYLNKLAAAPGTTEVYRTAPIAPITVQKAMLVRNLKKQQGSPEDQLFSKGDTSIREPLQRSIDKDLEPINILKKKAALEPHKIAGTAAYKEEKEWPSEFREKIRASIFEKLATDRSKTLSQIMAEVQREFNINPTDVARVYMKG